MLLVIIIGGFVTCDGALQAACGSSAQSGPSLRWPRSLFCYYRRSVSLMMPPPPSQPPLRTIILVLVGHALLLISPLCDPASRGTAIYGDPCSLTIDCGFPDSVCDENLKTCQCDPQKPVTNYVDKCGKHICREPFKLRQKNPDRDTFKHLVQNDD
ncbi:hypothetical protein MSG28_002637 [Choristoneura fumiferana]|uniref:Uncharacterized protein n=1 Tax=Choristoneura fumiferana TaxID=7141 RepID=A0ACC0JIN8_CHOFU|nr:hypothetical protein MSG28_002637 [Choristoneura fumiferana]